MKPLSLIFVSFLNLVTTSQVLFGGELIYLSSNTIIDANHPAIVSQALQLTEGLSQDSEKAVAIHDFVRDEVLFGFTSNLYEQSASQVLEAKVGYCVTKSTLFVALLRAAKIEARLQFVNISGEINIQFGTPSGYLDHAYTEVLIDKVWVAVDSYIVDSKLFNAAKRKLVEEGLEIGYGIHFAGNRTWDGNNPSFSQLVRHGRYNNLSTKSYGSYEGYKDFYANHEGDNRLNFFTRLSLWLFSTSLNSKIEALRSQSL